MKRRLMEHICSTQILIVPLMGISEGVRRSEMSYDLGGLSQLNLKHTIPLISTEVGQERFTRQPGSERAEAWRSRLLQNTPYTSVLKFNSRSCGVLCILPRKTHGQVMHSPNTLSNSARYKYLQKRTMEPAAVNQGSSSVLRGALQISTTDNIA